ncbi:uncharacterized protein LOC103982908 isoform X3 [Musa acuminata AAA Group]|uniref:uncharacterized protein LOC103982908 isoform X3 n=1 Tax=Musa acuminata AAA Group TaxID=214697 RepID=UPI0031DD27D8
MDKQVYQKRVKSGGRIFQRLACKQAPEDASSNDDKVPCNTPRGYTESTCVSLREGMASSSTDNGDAFMSSGEYVRDHGSLLSLQPWIFKTGSYQRDEELVKPNDDCSEKCGYEMDGFMYNSLPEISPQSISLGYACGRGQSTIRARRSHRSSIKPLSSTENCLIPQLYDANFEIEEFVFSSFPSSTTPGLRPFIVTDESKIVNKSSFGSTGITFDSGMNKGNMKNVTGVSSLPELRTSKRKSRETPHDIVGPSNSRRSHMISHQKAAPTLYPGLHDGIHIFSIGVSLGIISTVLSNRKEIENLNNMLKGSENLIQDLQEELEMKDAVTVKELANEACGHQKPVDSIAESIKSAIDQLPESYFPVEEKDEYDQLNFSKEESRSKIEAELEIELEKLELTMNRSSLNGTMLALGELDLDVVADVVYGELKADMLPGGVSEDQDDSASDSENTTNHNHNVNHAVSPRELSLRLHDVIQLRLEERIKELEDELQQTKKQLQSAESERLPSQRAFSSSDMESSSNQDSPTGIAGDTALAQPFCLNLAGDALDTYNEAYEEITRTANMVNNLPSTTNMTGELGHGLYSSEQSFTWAMEVPKRCGRETKWEQNLKSTGLNDDHEILEIHATNEDEYNDDEDDDEMKMLIEQILERTRQGSPIVLHAQRYLFPKDD